MTRPHVEPTAPVLLPAEDMPIGQEIDCGFHQVTEDEIVRAELHVDSSVRSRDASARMAQ